jgi:quinol monooxygenase YgiN
MAARVGFVVLYRWRIKPSHEQDFVDGWRRYAETLRKGCGSLGSRLHRAQDGTWVGYNQWPDQSTWERARQAPPPEVDGIVLMREAIEEEFPPMLLDPVAERR